MSTEVLKEVDFGEDTDLAVLHYISLPQPSLVEWFARGMDDMTQSILFGQYEHRVKQTFHSAGGMYQSGTNVNRKDKHGDGMKTWN
jgi:hypothetical protein